MAANSVDDGNFHVPAHRQMLQAVVADNQIALGMGQQASGGPRAVRVRRNRTTRRQRQQYGLVTNHDRVAVRPDLLWPVVGFPPVTARDDAGAQPPGNQEVRDPDDQRRLARAADADVADDDYGRADPTHMGDTETVGAAAQNRHGAIQPPEGCER